MDDARVCRTSCLGLASAWPSVLCFAPRRAKKRADAIPEQGLGRRRIP